MKLSEMARKVVDAIEECGASDKLTHAVTLAGELATALEFDELLAVAKIKGWKIPEKDDPFPFHSWTWYWRNCIAYDSDKTVGRPVPPHR